MFDGQMKVTDAHGRYEFIGVAAGSHAPDVALPAGLEAVIDPVTVTAVRGAAIGVAAVQPTEFTVHLPLVMR
jgi:hypothetical protein